MHSILTLPANLTKKVRPNLLTEKFGAVVGGKEGLFTLQEKKMLNGRHVVNAAGFFSNMM